MNIIITCKTATTTTLIYFLARFITEGLCFLSTRSFIPSYRSNVPTLILIFFEIIHPNWIYSNDAISLTNINVWFNNKRIPPPMKPHDNWIFSVLIIVYRKIDIILPLKSLPCVWIYNLNLSKMRYPRTIRRFFATSSGPYPIEDI